MRPWDLPRCDSQTKDFRVVIQISIYPKIDLEEERTSTNKSSWQMTWHTTWPMSCEICVGITPGICNPLHVDIYSHTSSSICSDICTHIEGHAWYLLQGVGLCHISACEVASLHGHAWKREVTSARVKSHHVVSITMATRSQPMFGDWLAKTH